MVRIGGGGQPPPAGLEKIPVWESRTYGPYILYEYKGNGIILTTGPDHVDLKIEYPHRLLALHLHLTDSSDVDSTDALDYLLKHLIHKGMELELRGAEDVTDTDIIEKFDADCDVYPPMQYRLTLQGTATNRVYARLIVEAL